MTETVYWWRGQKYLTQEQAHAALRRDLDQFARKDVKKAEGKGTRAAVREVIKPKARQLAPKDTGRLRRTVTKVRALQRSRTRQGHGLLAGSVLAQPGEAYYALFQEFGWRPRNQATGPYRAEKKRAGRIRHMDHMGEHAQPFLRPALWGQQPAIFNRVADVIARELFMKR